MCLCLSLSVCMCVGVCLEMRVCACVRAFLVESRLCGSGFVGVACTDSCLDAGPSRQLVLAVFLYSMVFNCCVLLQTYR